MLLAVVASLDRANGVANVLPYGQTTPIPARYQSHRGRPNCWPLGNCYIEQLASGQWQVNGGVGHRRVVLRDDFLHVSPLSATVGSILAAPCDTAWTYTAPAGSAQTATLAQAGLEAGTAALAVAGGNGVGQLIKDAMCVTWPPPVGLAYHVAVRIALNPIPAGAANGPAISVGLSDNTGGVHSNGVAVALQQNIAAGPSATFFISDGVSFTGTRFLATTPQAGVFYNCDIIAASTFGAAWVGLDGPYEITSTLPTGPMNVFCYVQSRGYVAGPATAYLESYELAVVPVVDPALVPGILGTSVGAH